MPMTKPKRVRKDDPPGQVTLHNFFAGNNSLTVAAPLCQKSGGTKSGRSKTVVKQEVIIIDSDSDDAYEIIEGTFSSSKRRRLNSDSAISDVFSFIKEETPQKHSISFGEPFLLRTGISERGKGSSSAAETGSGPSVIDIDLTLDDWENDDDETSANPKFEGLLHTNNKVIPEETLLNDTIPDWDIEFPLYDDDPFLGDDETEMLESRPSLQLSSSKPPSEMSLKNGNQENSDKHRKSNENNAFSILMSSFKEKEVWKEADIAEDKTARTHAVFSRRKAPFYKVLQGMPISVDAFRYGKIPGVTAYFLSHAHSDHYTNLSSSWKNGPIYCSTKTANLIIHMLNVDKEWVRPLPMDTPTLIPDSNGVTVTLIDANHCPGSCLFLFEGPQSINAGDTNFKSSFIGSSRIFRYLHCGDFRASPRHILHPALEGKVVDHVYLDTTYLDPRYTFSPQPLVISACAELVKKLINGEHTRDKNSDVLSWLAPFTGKGKEKVKERPLIVVGTYSIGKERLVKAIANAVNSKIYCDPRKAAILKCENDAELDALLTSDPKDPIVHLVPLATLTSDRLKIYAERLQGNFDKIIGFRPTGWTYTPSAGADVSPSIATILSKAPEQNFSSSDLRLSPKSTSRIHLYPVPYSEHSSFNELTCFAMSFNWVKMIATVNVGSETSRLKMSKWIHKWETERRKRGKDMIVPYRHPDYW